MLKFLVQLRSVNLTFIKDCMYYYFAYLIPLKSVYYFKRRFSEIMLFSGTLLNIIASRMWLNLFSICLNFFSSPVIQKWIRINHRILLFSDAKVSCLSLHMILNNDMISLKKDTRYLGVQLNIYTFTLRHWR